MTLSVSDPVTAIVTAALDALTAYLNFLCTPEGQKFADDSRQLTWDKLVALLPAPPDPSSPPPPPKTP